MVPKKTKKELTAARKAAADKKAAANREVAAATARMQTLHGEDTDSSTEDAETTSKSNSKTGKKASVAKKHKASSPRTHEKPFYLSFPKSPGGGGKPAAKKRKSTPTTLSQHKPSSPVLRKKLKLVSQLQKKKKDRVGADDDDYVEGSVEGSETDLEDSSDERKPPAIPRIEPAAAQPVLQEVAVPDAEEPAEEEPAAEEPPPQEYRAALIQAEARVNRAERQVRAISRTRLSDTFIEGQVRTWAKETLWKQCKFITNDRTMNRVMKKASKHFKVPLDERPHWMSTYAHLVRDGLNQKRNACSQDLRKTVKSKFLLCRIFVF